MPSRSDIGEVPSRKRCLGYTLTMKVMSMIDSLLTLTKGAILWFAIAEAIAVLLHLGISAAVGVQEPIFLVAALVIPVTFLVTGVYTLSKRLRHATRRGGPTRPEA